MMGKNLHFMLYLNYADQTLLPWIGILVVPKWKVIVPISKKIIQIPWTNPNLKIKATIVGMTYENIWHQWSDDFKFAMEQFQMWL